MVKLTVALIRQAMTDLWNKGQQPCPHAVHPRHARRRLALAEEDIDVWVRCGLCGTSLPLTVPHG